MHRTLDIGNNQGTIPESRIEALIQLSKVATVWTYRYVGLSEQGTPRQRARSEANRETVRRNTRMLAARLGLSTEEANEP